MALAVWVAFPYNNWSWLCLLASPLCLWLGWGVCRSRETLRRRILLLIPLCALWLFAAIQLLGVWRLLVSAYALHGGVVRQFSWAALTVRQEAVWLLLPLLCAPEGEPLRRWAEAEPQTRVGLGGGWQVQVWENPTAAAAREREDAPQEALPESVVEVQELDYPHQAACRIPTKVTATQLKGRELDEEIAQGTVRRVRQVQVDTPRFLLGERPLSAAQRGTAMHLLMQYLDLNGPDPEEQAASLTARHLLTPEQAASLDLEQVRRFLASPLAQRIRRAEQVYREYRFSLLLPAALYDPAAEPEDELMLQGVVDCAFRTEQGLVIVDFKTDRIRPEEAPARAELYRPQLTAYSQALSRVLETPVAEMVLYFFAPGCEVRL